MEHTTQLTDIPSYEAILSRMRASLVERDPSFTALDASDPAMKVLEVAAWRELLLRHQIEEAMKANLLAFAKHKDLDHLALFYGVERQAGEEDESYRIRIQTKIKGWSTAGTAEHYRYHALSADIRVKDARVESPMPGLVRISILSKEGSGTPSEALLKTVQAAVLKDDIRMLTDKVEVVGYRIIPVRIVARVSLYPNASERSVELARTQVVKRLEETKSLGWDLTRSWITAQLFVEGIQSVEVLAPKTDLVVADQECVTLEGVEIEVAGYRW
jgi:phage-related baseplate assembly protein